MTVNLGSRHAPRTVGFADSLRGFMTRGRRLFGHGVFAPGCRYPIEGEIFARVYEAWREFYAIVAFAAGKLHPRQAMLASFAGVCLTFNPFASRERSNFLL